MKLGSWIVGVLGAFLLASPSFAADSIAPDQPVARAVRDLVVRSPYEDGPLLELVHRAQLEAAGADVSLAPPLPEGLRLPAGPVTAGDILSLAPAEPRLVVVELGGRQLRELLESTARRFATYTYEHGRPLLAPGAPDSVLDTLEGVSYALDLTRPAGSRVLHLTFRGVALDSARTLRVVMDERRLERGDLEGPPTHVLGRRGDALLAHLRRRAVLDGAFEPSWSLLPDYVTLRERPHVDRLVRMGVAPREEVHRLLGDQPARRADLAYWLARSFGWRETRLSGAYPDAPDWLEPWLDGLLRRKVLEGAASDEFFRPFAPARLPLVFQWCENAARHAGYALGAPAEIQGFRRGLLAGTSLDVGSRSPGDTLTRAQVVGLVANARFPEIRVLQTTDLHGALRPRDRGSARQKGGAAALAAHARRLRAENPEGTVLLDGGDLFQGTLVSNRFFGRAVVELMNDLGYAAAAVGNHEFDWSVDTLAARAAEMRFATLAANVRQRGGGRPWWARPDTVLTRRGVRVGVLGLAYPGTPSVTRAGNVSTLRFEDDSAAAARVVPALRERRASALVIGLGHVPATQDGAGRVHGDLARLARGVPGVDLWLGGHSHTRVASEVGGVPVMIAGSHGEWIALCDLVVDPVRDRVVERRSRLVPTWVDEVEPDSAAQAIAERWERLLGDQGAAVVGRSLRRLTRNRGGESPVGSLVADVMRESTGAEIALQNVGGLRAELPEGPITAGMVFEVIPFENRIVTLTLSGAEVRRALEEGLAHERVVQVSGIRYRFDLGAPVGSRVTALADSAGRPLDPERRFLVATNDFMAQGGDGHGTLSAGRDRRDTGLDLRAALERSLRRRCQGGAALDYRGDGRVTREPGSKPPARE
jgi:2',3'-cyclic-nucleotide 2'-phosphodiesterase (5'-nucleotidase family)